MSNGNARYYNTGKVLIGIAYQRPLPQLTREGEFIQSVLLGERPAQYWSTRGMAKGFAVVVGLMFAVLVVAQVVGAK